MACSQYWAHKRKHFLLSAPSNHLLIFLTRLSPVPASVAAMLYAGYIGDKYTLWMARRNNGVHIPGHRLLLLIIPGLVG